MKNGQVASKKQTGQVQATLVYNGKDIARLDFDPATGLLRARGRGVPPPPADPRGPRSPRGPGAPGAPVPPAPEASGPVPPAPVPSAPEANAPAPAGPANLDQIKASFAGIVKGLSTGQGAEIMPGEGFWKVSLIFQNRMVGEIHVSGDGTKVVEDFMAARDAAIFAR